MGGELSAAVAIVESLAKLAPVVEEAIAIIHQFKGAPKPNDVMGYVSQVEQFVQKLQDAIATHKAATTTNL